MLTNTTEVSATLSRKNTIILFMTSFVPIEPTSADCINHMYYILLKANITQKLLI